MPRGNRYVGSGMNPKTARGDDEHVLNRVFNGDVNKFDKWLETLSEEELDKLQKNPFTYKVKEEAKPKMMMTKKRGYIKYDDKPTKSPVKDTVK